MGNDIKQMHLDAIPSWLDPETRDLVSDLILTLTQRRDDVLAIVLYGSIARHDERPVDDPHPSDVDVFVVFDTDDPHIEVHEGKQLFAILGRAYDRHLDALREVKFMFASRTLAGWDPLFVRNVARDGIVLFVDGRLPVPLVA